MNKLTKSEIRKHTAAIELLDRGSLSDDDILFVFKNATQISSKAGAFLRRLG